MTDSLDPPEPDKITDLFDRLERASGECEDARHGNSHRPLPLFRRVRAQFRAAAERLGRPGGGGCASSNSDRYWASRVRLPAHVRLHASILAFVIAFAWTKRLHPEDLLLMTLCLCPPIRRTGQGGQGPGVRSLFGRRGTRRSRAGEGDDHAKEFPIVDERDSITGTRRCLGGA